MLFLSQHKGKLLILVILIGLGVTGSFLFRSWQQTVREGQLNDYLLRAKDALEDEEYAEAFDLYSQALALEPGDTNILTRLGDVAFAAGDYEQSVLFYQDAEQMDRAEAHYYLSLKAIAELDLDAAIKELIISEQQADESDVLSTTAVTNLKTELQELVNEENKPLLQAQLGRILIEQRAPSLAIQALKPLTESEPTYRDAHYLLAAAYYQQGDLTSAETSVNKALDIDTNFEPALDLLSEIQQNSTQ